MGFQAPAVAVSLICAERAPKDSVLRQLSIGCAAITLCSLCMPAGKE